MIKHNLEDINEILRDYSQEIQEGIENAAIDVAKEGVKRLKASKNSYKVRTGKYNKSWKSKVEKGLNYIHVSVHNSKYGSLTHLLENGHATRNGGRTKKYVHIKPVEEYINKTFEQEVDKVVKGSSK